MPWLMDDKGRAEDVTDEVVEVFSGGCPEGIEKYVFQITVHLPDESAEEIRRRRQGTVVAEYLGDKAGSLDYGLGPGPYVAVTRVWTEERFRCRGCASQMAAALISAFPTRQMVDGGNSNSAVGDFIVARRRIGEIGGNL